MNVLDAAYAVLLDAGTPLHGTVITQRMLDRKLWRTEGKTPVNTVGAALAVDVKRHGAASRFVRTTKGVFGLRDLHWAGLPLLQSRGVDLPPPRFATEALTEEETVAVAPAAAATLPPVARTAAGTPAAIAQQNEQVRQTLLRELLTLTPDDFLGRVERLLAALALQDRQVVLRWGESGFDVRATLPVAGALRVRLLVQVRRWRHTVQAADIMQLRGSLGAHEQGLLITTGDMGGSARDEADRTDTAPVGLIDGRSLVLLLAEHGIGVRRTAQVLLELGEGDE